MDTELIVENEKTFVKILKTDFDKMDKVYHSHLKNKQNAKLRYKNMKTQKKNEIDDIEDLLALVS